MAMKAKTGVIHGRFQPVHVGHMEYLVAGKERCEFLYVGISVPDPRYLPEKSLDDHRSYLSSNPFTYYDRLSMVRDALLGAGVLRQEFEIVPFPIDFPEYLRYYVPPNCRFFVTIYDDWGREKVKRLEVLGADVEIMWERSMKDRLTTGSEIREAIGRGRPWRHLVPGEVFTYITAHSLDVKLREMTQQYAHNSL